MICMAFFLIAEVERQIPIRQKPAGCGITKQHTLAARTRSGFAQTSKPACTDQSLGYSISEPSSVSVRTTSSNPPKTAFSATTPTRWPLQFSGERQQRDVLRSLDRDCEPALMPRTGARHTARENFAALLQERSENFRPLIVDVIRFLDAEAAHLLLADKAALASTRASRGARALHGRSASLRWQAMGRSATCGRRRGWRRGRLRWGCVFVCHFPFSWFRPN